MMIKYLLLLVLAFVQNVAFSMVSRSRNRDNLPYHMLAAILSNGVWFLTFAHLTKNLGWDLFVPYTIGTVSGSVYGVKISMWIESRLNARSDSHLEKKP